MADSGKRNQRVPNIGDLPKKYYGHTSSLQLQIMQKFCCKFRIFISILLSYCLYSLLLTLNKLFIILSLLLWTQVGVVRFPAGWLGLMIYGEEQRF